MADWVLLGIAATSTPATGQRRRPSLAELKPTQHEIVLHGHRVSYRTAGDSGPVVLLIHGIVGCAEQWDQVVPLLAERYTVVAPDLLGHGQSATPRGDYSLGAYAASVRDLLVALGHRRATVVGHSLGGGVAMQFAYEYPRSPSGSCWSRAGALVAMCIRCSEPRRCPGPRSCSP